MNTVRNKYIINSAFSLLFFLVFNCSTLSANDRYKYVVFFKDKLNNTYTTDAPKIYLSERSIDRRHKHQLPIEENDLPVSIYYKERLQKALNCSVLSESKWLNAVLIEGDSSLNIEILDTLSFFNGIKKVATYSKDNTLNYSDCLVNDMRITNETTEAYGMSAFQIEQLSGDFLHDKGYTGDGMLIAVIDAGYRSADTMFSFAHVFDDSRLIEKRNIVSLKKPVFNSSSHGTYVWSIMAGRLPYDYSGTAPDASYVLIVSEDAKSEQLVEEFNYVVALEFADSIGVDVVNTSLGYTQFDQNLNNHQLEDLNGDKAMASIGSDIAASKGMLIVTSAGNEGADEWKYISVPADADSVLAIGAIDRQGAAIGFSSFGPEIAGQVKPNIVALGRDVAYVDRNDNVVLGSGTSFSAPIISGLATCLWQAFPDKTNMEIFSAIENSASHFYKPNNKTGYGLPNFRNAYQILQTEEQNREANFVRINGNIIYKGSAVQLVFDDYTEIINVTLSNVEGKIYEHSSHAVNGRKYLDLHILSLYNYLTDGVYFLTLRSQNNVTTKKVFLIN